jgi:3-deoxy-D-manno-octulosonic-acid transferase
VLWSGQLTNPTGWLLISEIPPLRPAGALTLAESTCTLRLVNVLPLRVWRWLYGFVLLLAYPWARLRPKWRARHEPEYALRVGERFGQIPENIPAGVIWFHTVSAGEAIAAAPLIAALAREFADEHFLITATTPAGSAQIRRLLTDHYPNTFHCYAPFDFPHVLRRFYRQLSPRLLVLVETELWPNLLEYARRNDVGVLLINGRLSKKSASGYARVRPLVAEMLSGLRFLACQYPVHARRFLDLGARAEALGVLGSLKFDVELPPDHQQRVAQLHTDWQLADRYVWVAGSTHEGEETIVLNAHRQLLAADPTALLILAPRHPSRCDSVVALLDQLQLRYRRLSDGAPAAAHKAPAAAHKAPAAAADRKAADIQVLLLDSLGELQTLYGLSDVAFLGGSLVSVGGHNPIEAAICEQPLLMGAGTFNFPDVVAAFQDVGALKLVADAESLTRELLNYHDDESARVRDGEAARQVVVSNRGALARLLKLLGAEIRALV